MTYLYNNENNKKKYIIIYINNFFHIISDINLNLFTILLDLLIDNAKYNYKASLYFF